MAKTLARAVTKSVGVLLLGWAATAPAVAQGSITRVSVDSSGAEGNGFSGRLDPPSLSADGRHVAFDSVASNLVAGDGNDRSDVFVHDRASGVTVRVSFDSAGVEGNLASVHPSLSRDGRFVAFESDASNLVASDGNGARDVFVHDRDPDGNGIFDEGNGVTTLVSVDSGGTPGDGDSHGPSLSADGVRVAFWSHATHLAAGDTNGRSDVFVHDRATATTTMASVNDSGNQGRQESYFAAISADGNFVAFTSWAGNLVPDTNRASDVFVRDLVQRTTRRASVDSAGGEAGSDSGGAPALSSDGSRVAFMSWADDLVPNDTNGVADCFVHDFTTGATTRVSVDSAGAQADGGSEWPQLSDDGQVVVFGSEATNLGGSDDDDGVDVFVHDCATGITTPASRNGMGVLGDRWDWYPTISADGRLVAFDSESTNLVPGDTNAASDVFVQERAAEIDACWRNYGAGFAGTLGIPTLAASADPAFGAVFTLDVGNSLGAATPALLLLGPSAASIPTPGGGTLLVDVALAVVQPIALAAAGSSLAESVPFDESLVGARAYVQAIELDPGARGRLSFTPGVELVLGM